MQNKCALILERLPYVPVERIRDAVAATDTLEDALDLLLNQEKDEADKQVQRLLELLPRATRKEVESLLRRCETPDEVYERLKQKEVEHCEKVDEEQLSSRCAYLADLHPELPLEVVSRAANASPSLLQANRLLVAEDEERNKFKFTSSLEIMKDLFPDKSEESIRTALSLCKYDITRAADMMASSAEPAPRTKKTSPEAGRRDRQAAGRAGRMQPSLGWGWTTRSRASR